MLLAFVAVMMTARCSAPPQAPAQTTLTVPDLSGNDPHWIKVRNKDCWAYNLKPKAGEVMVWMGNCQGRLASGFGEQHWYTGVNQDGTYSADKLTEIVDGNSVGGIMQGRSHIMTPSGAYEGIFENGVLKSLVETAPTTPAPYILSPVQSALQPAPNYVAPSTAGSGAERQAGAQYASSLDAIIRHDAAGWIMNKYDSGSVRNIRVTERNGKVVEIRGDYTFNGNESGWVRADFRRHPPCLEYSDTEGTCRSLDQSRISILAKAIRDAHQHNQPGPSDSIDNGTIAGHIMMHNFWNCGDVVCD